MAALSVLFALLIVGVRSRGSSSSSSSSSSGTYCDMCGASASYTETVSGDKRTIVTTGCPNHYAVCTGKPGASVSNGGTCGDVGAEGTGTEAFVRDLTFDIPANPVIATEVDTTPQCSTSEIGVSLNGVPIYGGAVDADCTILAVDEDVILPCSSHGPDGFRRPHGLWPAPRRTPSGPASTSAAGTRGASWMIARATTTITSRPRAC